MHDLKHKHRSATTALPLLASCAVAVGGSLIWILIPLLVDTLRHTQIATSEHQVGLIGSADFTGMFFGAILALLTVAKLDRRWLAFAGLAALCLGDIGSILTNSLFALYANRLLAGIGGGLAMGVAYAAFGAAIQPERWFAIFLVLQTALGSAVILFLSPLLEHSNLTPLYATSLGFAVLGAAAAFAIEPRAPVYPEKPGLNVTLRRASIWKLGPLTVATYFLFGLAALAIWANIESIGKSFGLSQETVSTAISISLLGCIAGELFVVATGKRWGRTGPTLLVALFYFAGAALLLTSPGQLGFVAAATAFQFGTNLGSYAFGAISEADPSGRMSVTYLLSLKAGFAAGPLVASWRVAGASYGPIISLGIVLSLIVCALIVAQIRVAHVLVTRTS